MVPPVPPLTLEEPLVTTPSRRSILTASLVAGVGLTAAPVAAAAAPRQSPVDIHLGDVRRRRGLPRLEVHYSRSTTATVNYRRRDESAPDGCSTRGVEETEAVVVPAGAGWLRYGGTRYDLQQFHFHTPSEHTVGGRHAPLEQHFVHTSADGSVLVIAVLLLPGPRGAADPVLTHLPRECGTPVDVEGVDLRAMLPARTATVRYSGSFTTEPYTEPVQWLLTAPRTASPAGIRAFQDLFPEGDYRQAQPLNGRVLVTDADLDGW